jgi:glycosyltransferase involved in cell wall biosynthesis
MLVIHGIDAWTRHRNWFVRHGLRFVDVVVGVSRVTLDRFARWSDVTADRFRLLPNCVDLRMFSPGPKPERLAQELGLSNRTVIMTLGRLASEERYKGFDEVMETLPELARHIPQITYLICGDGPDRHRLEAKASALGVGERVVFAGFVPETLKSDYYRLADAYVMPSRGEGFGIVILEALASGLPVLGSLADGSREALLEGALGELVEPSRPDEVRQGILRTLARGKGNVADIGQFSVDAFRARASALAREVLA